MLMKTLSDNHNSNRNGGNTSSIESILWFVLVVVTILYFHYNPSYVDRSIVLLLSLSLWSALFHVVYHNVTQYCRKQQQQQQSITNGSTNDLHKKNDSDPNNNPNVANNNNNNNDGVVTTTTATTNPSNNETKLKSTSATFWRRPPKLPIQLQQQQQLQPQNNGDYDSDTISGKIMSIVLVPVLIVVMIHTKQQQQQHQQVQPNPTHPLLLLTINDAIIPVIISIVIFLVWEISNLSNSTMLDLDLLLSSSPTTSKLQQHKNDRRRRWFVIMIIFGFTTIVPVLLLFFSPLWYNWDTTTTTTTTTSSTLVDTISSSSIIHQSIVSGVVFLSIYISIYFVPSLQCVITKGEWILFTALVSFVLIQYIIKLITTIGNTTTTSINNYNTISYSTIASISGIFGCIIGCCLVESIWGGFINLLTNNTMLSKEKNHNNNNNTLQQRNTTVTKNNSTIIITFSVLGAIIQFLLILIIALLVVETNFICFNYNNTNWNHLLNYNKAPTITIVVKYYLPRCLRWIILDFLRQPERSIQGQYIVEQTTINPTLAVTLQTILQYPRYVWLFYWICVLLIMIPLAPTTTTMTATTINQSEKKELQTKNNNNRKTRFVVVVARKWFHLIAVLLFTPCTILVPEMQSLSYAIAIAVLLSFESIRRYNPTLNAFYKQYLDASNKDENDTTIILSHIGLVLGCAIPLWISQYCYNVNYSENETLDEYNTGRGAIGYKILLSLWGIICLGVGDAMGAVIGTFYGKYKWGQHNRTVEGSVGMFLSMCFCCYTYQLSFQSPASSIGIVSWLPAVIFVTILEAYTWQIDNFILPLAGCAVLLLSSSN